MMKRLRRTLGASPVTQRPNTSGYEPLDRGESDVPGVATAFILPRNDGSAVVYWYFWVLGAVLICSFPLLGSYFPAGSNHRTNLASYLGTTYCFGNLLFLGYAQRTVAETSPISRIRWSLVLLIVLSTLSTVLIIPALLPALSSTPTLLLAILLALTGLLSISTAYLQSGVFALAALWPTHPGSNAHATLGVMSGQGGIAVLVSAVQLVLAVTEALHKQDAEEGNPSLLAGVGLWGLGSLGAVACYWTLGRLQMEHGHAEVVAQMTRRMAASSPALDSGGRAASEKTHTMSVLKKNIWLNIAVAWVFTVTLSIFPPLTTAIVSTHRPTPTLLLPAVFIPFHFLIFNIGDYLGRTYMPRIPKCLPTSHPAALLLSLSRTLFIPLFLLCNVSTSPSNTAKSVWINSDVAYFAILLAFGLTNGWVSSICMILASDPVLNPRIEEEERDIAGTLAAFCLVGGLAAGSAASFGVNWIVRGSFI